MISIFAKPPFILRHLQRVSSIVRGEQIAAYMGNARLNPESGYENDTCIFVKPHIKSGNSFDFPKKSWIDIHESIDLVEVLNRYSEVGVIALSELDVETLKKYVKNKIVLIPHHHLNFERARRERTGIKTIGFTGSAKAMDYIPQEIIEGIKKRGLKLEFHSQFYPRTSVAKFHQSIDIHLVWRHWLNRKLSCPFKIINAASFGVPTIALDEPSFKEVEGTYIGVKTPIEWLDILDFLIKEPKIYEDIANTCIEKSEKYHISEISKLYKELDQ